MPEIRLREYERAIADPAGPHACLRGLFLDAPSIRDLFTGDPLRRKLEVSENRYGLCLKADRWVGVVRLGPVRVHIEPKLPAGTLWPLMAYALGLDKLFRWSTVAVDEAGDFVDLLAQALLAEAELLWRGGLHRAYQERSAWLTTPRGRPELGVLAGAQPLTRAALPCRHHAFTTDVPVNQTVLAGLSLASSIAQSILLRSALHRAVQRWRECCTLLEPSPVLLEQGERQLNRLCERYSTALELVRVLAAGMGLDSNEGAVKVPGFLWDMAAVFERFVFRFLREHLLSLDVSKQVGLDDLYSIHRGRPSLRTPRPRPDLVIRRGEQTLAVLDTKYADLAHRRPSRDVLYQASVYALAWSGTANEDVPAILLYPSPGSSLREVEIHLRIAGTARPRRILLRGVDWVRAGELVWEGGSFASRQALAKRWSDTSTGTKALTGSTHRGDAKSGSMAPHPAVVA